MRPPRRIPAPRRAPACAVAALLGAALGWLTAPAPSRSEKSDTPAARSAASSVRTSSDDSASTFSRASADSPPATAAPWSDRWETTLALASTPARTRALSELLEELARADARRALSLAQNQPDWRLRDLLRDASLRGWAAASPEAAGDWALGVRIEERRAVVAAVFQGAAAEDPAAASALALRLCASDPYPSGDYGHAAIAALTDVGAFAQAAEFGAAMGARNHDYIFKSAYFEWARQRPAEALAAAAKIADPRLAAQARAQAITGWSWADAEGLARHALTLPPGPERGQALAEALPLWLERHPGQAAAWIQENETGSEFDAGLAALANQQTFLKSSPGAALALASDISDPAKRGETLRSVFGQWAARDPRAARAYLNNTAATADRAALAAIFADVHPDSP